VLYYIDTGLKGNEMRIDMDHMERIRLSTNAKLQKTLGRFFVGPNYFFSKVDIQIENIERIPTDETVIFALNHTDRYNYWPFQYKMWRMNPRLPYTTTWVKGDYYNNFVLGKFFDWTNNIPVPSRGYIIKEDFRDIINRKISQFEYRLLRDLVNGKKQIQKLSEEITEALKTVLEYPRHLIDEIKIPYAEYIERYYRMLMAKVAEINFNALFEKRLNVIIFPEGTRSDTLTSGKTGISHLALKSRAKVVPVGCSGSDTIYPGNSPVAKKGKVVYRVGMPIDPRDFIEDERKMDFVPFSRDAEDRLADELHDFALQVMEAINELLDERYRSLQPVTVV